MQITEEPLKAGEDDLLPENIEALAKAFKEMEEREEDERRQKLDKLSKHIAKLRDEAVASRKNSGFEKQWLEDEEFYIGIDDLNRGEDQHQYHKPGNGSDVLREKRTANGNQCTAFLNITAPFVDAAAARCSDILLPANDWNFGIRPTPIPEFEDHANDQTPMILGAGGQPMATVGDAIQEHNKEASKRVRKAETRIRDWLVQSNYRTECRKVIEGAALVGTGILKGPYPKKHNKQAFVEGKLNVEDAIDPSTCQVSHWNFFPDMNCGEDIQDGDYVFERDYLYARSLIDLKGQGYIDSAIDKVIEEGPGKRNAQDARQQKQTEDDERFEVWYCYKYITSKDLRLIDEEYDQECSCNVDEEGSEIQPDMKPFMASIMMVNDTIIYGRKWPIDGKGFPFDVFVWQRVASQPFGIGVARQGRTPQKTVLAAYRTLMNNQGLASKPMLAFLQEAIEPVDKNWELYGGKMWRIKAGKGIKSINEAIQTVVIPSMQEDLAALIQFGMKAMEDATGITFLLQGQQGSAPDTVGGMQMMLQSSSTLLRRITRVYDECTVSHIQRYYSWLLLFGPDDEKGDYLIEATGSSSLLEREIQAMQLPQLLQFAMNPSFEISPKKAMDEVIKAWRFDPSKFEMDEAEKQAMAQSQPQDPRLITEQLKSQTALQIAEQRAQIEMQKLQVDQDRELLFSQGVAERNKIDYESKIAELQLKREIAMLEYALKNQMQLEDIKSQLSQTAMKIQSTKELAAMSATADRLPKPPIEPRGKAPKGQSFQK